MLCSIFSFNLHEDTVKSVLIMSLLLMRKWTLNGPEQFTSPFRTSARFNIGSCTQSPSSLVWIWARSDAHSSVGSFSYGKRKAGEETPLLEELGKACMWRTGSCWEVGIALFPGETSEPRTGQHRGVEPLDTGVCAFSCLREEGRGEGVGCVSWVPRVAAPCQGILGAIGKSRHSLPPALDRMCPPFLHGRFSGYPPKTMTLWESGHRPEW